MISKSILSLSGGVFEKILTVRRWKAQWDRTGKLPVDQKIRTILRQIFQRSDNPMQIEHELYCHEIARLGSPPDRDFEMTRQAMERGDLDEARKLAAAIDLQNMPNVPSARFHDFTLDEKISLSEVSRVALSTPQAAISLMRAVRYVVENDIPGSFVECGVYAGGSVMAILRTLLQCGVTDRDVYLFDTFEGMPLPDARDVFYTGTGAKEVWDSLKRGDEGGSDWTYFPLEQVTKNVMSIGYPMDRVHFVKGLVENTLPDQAPDSIALLRLDTDFYSSTKHELVHLYPKLSKAGVLVLDDYGCFQGSRLATDEYISEHKIPIFLNRVDEHVRFAVKPS